MIKFNKEKSMKLLTVLGNATFKEVSDEDRVKLNEYLEELIQETAAKYKINIKEEYIDVATLKAEKY